GHGVVADDHDLPHQVVFLPEILIDQQEKEAVGQQQHADTRKLHDDEGPRDHDLVKEIEIERHEADEIEERVHRPAGEGLEVDDGLAVVDAAERGDQDPADVHKIQEIVVLEHGRNGQASAEQHLREEKDKIDDSQVQYHQGDLEMIQKPVVHSGKVLKGLFEVYSGRKQGAKEGFLGMVIHEALEALHRQRMPFGAGHGAGDAFDVFGVDGIADFI